MSDPDKNKDAPAGEIPSETATPPKPNGAPAAAAAPPEESPRLSRFARYFNRPVGLQLKTPIIALDFGGDYMQVDGERYGLLDLALMRNEKGQPEPVGMMGFLPRVILHASSDGEYLVAWITSPTTGAIIECNLDPDQIDYVIFCARAPRESSIIAPAGTLS